MPITPLPALDRTSATFKTDTDVFFGSLLPAFSVELEALRLTSGASAEQVDAAVILTNDDRIAAETAAAEALTRSAAAALSEYNAGLSAAQVATSGTAATLAANLLLPGGGALVGNTPAGTIAATTTQGAINELDAEKVAKTDVIAITKGGTGATTANAAADALGAFRRGTLLGTVSQTAGVPTGAVIERGSNANGAYVKWADGTLICTHTKAGTLGPTTLIGSMYVTNGDETWEYPSAFASSAPVLSAQVVSGLVFSWVGLGAGATMTEFNYRVFSPTSSSAIPGVALIAIGRWY
jgi:hypothetical protein